MREFFNSNSFTSQDDDLEKEGIGASMTALC